MCFSFQVALDTKTHRVGSRRSLGTGYEHFTTKLTQEARTKKKCGIFKHSVYENVNGDAKMS